MNSRFSLSAIVIVSVLLTFYAVARKFVRVPAEIEEVVFDDGYKTGGDEIVIEDSDFEGGLENVPASVRVAGEETKTTPDGSQISTMFDRYGNKTEKRTFNSHPRLALVLVRTDGANGKREVLVYGQSGEVKGLPENMLDKVLTVSADEIANSAGILHVQRQNSAPLQNAAPRMPPFQQTPPLRQNPPEEPGTNDGERNREEQKADSPDEKLQSSRFILQREVNQANLPRRVRQAKAAARGD